MSESSRESLDPVSPTTTITPQHATAVQIAINNSDFVFVFTILKPHWGATQGLIPGISMEPISAVSLGPIVAKQFLRQLTQAIAGFESATQSAIPDVGEITQRTEASLQEPNQ